MVEFKFIKNKDIHISFLDLLDLIRASSAEEFENVRIGPFEYYSRAYLGIIIDGDGEKELADEFEKLLKKVGRCYCRKNKYGDLFYVREKQDNLGGIFR